MAHCSIPACWLGSLPAIASRGFSRICSASVGHLKSCSVTSSKCSSLPTSKVVVTCVVPLHFSLVLR